MTNSSKVMLQTVTEDDSFYRKLGANWQHQGEYHLPKYTVHKRKNVLANGKAFNNNLKLRGVRVGTHVLWKGGAVQKFTATKTKSFNQHFSILHRAIFFPPLKSTAWNRYMIWKLCRKGRAVKSSPNEFLAKFGWICIFLSMEPCLWIQH